MNEKTIPAYTKIHQFIQSADLIGSFGAYIRRPIPQLSGMVAQFFGPNGEDSDSVLALSLTKYLDAEVFISVYQVKDADGSLMKLPTGEYPKIAEFLAITRRSVPARGGMVAQFFASNGENSDAINELGKSKYQDSLVFVEVRGKFAQLNKSSLPTPLSTIEQEYASKVSQHEIKEYKKKEKTFKKLNDQLLLAGFLKNSDVLYSLGTKEDYISWLTQNGCCWPGAGTEICTNDPVIPFELKTIAPNFNYLVFCEEHLEIVENNITVLPGQATYLEMKQSICVQNWAMSELKKKFSLVPELAPDSTKILDWAISNSLDKHLPSSYRKVAQTL